MRGEHWCRVLKLDLPLVSYLYGDMTNTIFLPTSEAEITPPADHVHLISL